ncbi:Phophatidylserine decarboxylase-domain-containing protein [Aspergillus leporis]|uniref:Phophatidylserine decarboxylase-domain-containing protein n=1 Tax=Aspergillus leporis TaxID=41062 RepID=A0A5N5WP99_9EURO|nr:Phophatidylserine decarboxylase-domain-containing protein [Aspergillus leporis]
MMHTWLWSAICRTLLFLLCVRDAVGGSEIPRLHRAQRPGLWLPKDYRIQQEWTKKVARDTLANPKPLHPAVQDLKDLIEGDSRIYLLANGMYDDIPANFSDPSGQPVVRSYTQMLSIMNHLLTIAPSWSEHENQVGLVGLPMHALVDWPMGTFHGHGFFLDPAVNAILKRVLDAWGDYLQSPASAEVLNNSTTGWFSPAAIEQLTAVANVDGSSYSFEELFVCDPSEKHYNFTSWDGFFTRAFREERRPVAEPHDDSVIANVCESLPFAIAHDVKRRDRFWVKGQPYSVEDMLGNDELSERFVGGTVYQAYLSSLSYHRWHAPVTGTIVKVARFNGTYFSEPLFASMEIYGAWPKAPRYSQGYLSAVAARAIVYIQADNPAIGLMAVVEVGMSEVSSCEVTVKEGQRVVKGDEMGMFHFGGSTHCLLFGKGVKVSGFPEPGSRTDNVPVRSRLAVVEEV